MHYTHVYTVQISIFLPTALFYYSLGNLSLSNRSSLNSIQLFAVIKSTDLQEYGPNVILEPLMRDVETLEGVSNIIDILSTYYC